MDTEIENQIAGIAQQLEQKAAAQLEQQKAQIEKEAQARVLAALKSRLGLA